MIGLQLLKANYANCGILGSPAKVGGKYQKYYLCKKKAMQDSQMLLEVVRLILPEEFLTYFKITKVTKVKDVITLFMDEFDSLPADRKGHKVESKGFLSPITIQDFPVRFKKVTLKVRRRKWYDSTTKEYLTNKYDLLAKGTHYSKEFAAFLKELPRDIPRIGPLS